MESDIIVLGSSIDLGDVTGAMRSFMERLYFSNLSYNDRENRSVCQKNIASVLIGCNAGANEAAQLYRIVSMSQILYDTAQWKSGTACIDPFDNYADYAASNFEEKHKAKVGCISMGCRFGIRSVIPFVSSCDIGAIR